MLLTHVMKMVAVVNYGEDDGDDEGGGEDDGGDDDGGQDDDCGDDGD